MPGSVLIIDDDSEMASELAEALREFGYDASFLVSSKAVWNAFKEGNRYDYLIIDEVLDSLSGTQLYRKAKLAFELSGSYALLLTGHADLDRSINAIRAGFCDFLQKPISAREIDISLKNIASQMRSGEAEAELPASAAIRLLKRIAKPSVSKEDLPSIPMLAILAVCQTYRNKGETLLTKAIASETGLPLSSVVRHLNELETLGYVSRNDASDDKRRTLVELTEAGDCVLRETVRTLQASLVRDS